MRFYIKTVLILLLCIFIFTPISIKAEGLEAGDKVQDFTLASGLTGDKVNFNNDIKGKTKYAAIIFANSSCGACRKELKTLSKLSDEVEGFMTYVVLVDMKGAEIVEAFSKRFNYNVTYLLDPDFSIPPIYGFYFTPSLVIVDEAGTIVYKKGGYNINKDEDILTNTVKGFFK